MAYVITDECIGCGACASECPVDAIVEKDGKYEIKKDDCIDCGSCAATCPVEAPVAEQWGTPHGDDVTLLWCHVLFFLCPSVIPFDRHNLCATTLHFYSFIIPVLEQPS